MKTNAALLLLLAIAFSCCLAGAEETSNTPPSRHMTLQEAVQWAPKHNHDIRIASYMVEEKREGDREEFIGVAQTDGCK
jgi:hypothetical protein